MINRFAEVKQTHNPITPQMAIDAVGIMAAFASERSFNIAGSALMDVAHDLHAHGDSNENLMAASILSGIASGLSVAASEKSLKKICKFCGRRH